MWSSKLRKSDESPETGDPNDRRVYHARPIVESNKIDNKPKVRDEIEVEEIEGRGDVIR